jgi:heavy metal translocating P-type ATPase
MLRNMHRIVVPRIAAEWAFFGTAAGLLGIGLVASLAGASVAATAAWSIGTVVGLLVSLAVTGVAVLHRQPSVDVIAVLALVGTLVVAEAFAGAMITVMLATGRLLDARAEARAQRDLRLLVERAPRRARRRVGDSEVEDVALDQVQVGDRLVVAAGEIVPVDGRLLTPAVLDESALTGEPLPVGRTAGDEVRSGLVNAGAPLDLVTTVAAAESTYAGVVRLVQSAQAGTARFVRSADRLAAWFVPLTLLVAAIAWAAAGTAERAVAVLVVATPCPLLLAAPIALMSGMSRAARIGVIVKGGRSLEQLAAGRVMLFDRTGTLTSGRPRLTDIVVASPQETLDDEVTSTRALRPVTPSELLRTAASLDQLSPHVLASAVVTAAARRGLQLQLPEAMREVHGYGVEGAVQGHTVRLGRANWVLAGHDAPWARAVGRRAVLDSAIAVFVAVDGRPVGALLFSDPLRPDAARMVRAVRSAGIERVVLVTGDRVDVAERIGRHVGVDDVRADCDPAQKLEVLRQESSRAATVMVGDGINDAPALAAAGAGVALAARGATASSDAADVVLIVDRLDVLATAVRIARRCRRIALEAVAVGMGLCAAAMAAAAVGLLAPAAGAITQECIDVLAIIIALRALTPDAASTPPLSTAEQNQTRALHDRMKHSSHSSTRSPRSPTRCRRTTRN